MNPIDELTKWFAVHHGARKFVKGLVLFAVGYLVTNQAEVITALPPWAIIPAGAIITMLANWLQNEPKIPILGKKVVVVAKKVAPS